MRPIAAAIAALVLLSLSALAFGRSPVELLQILAYMLEGRSLVWDEAFTAAAEVAVTRIHRDRVDAARQLVRLHQRGARGVPVHVVGVRADGLAQVGHLVDVL